MSMPERKVITLDQRNALGLTAAAAVIIGSLGPWREFLFVSVSGTQGGGDGMYTLGMGIIAAVLIIATREHASIWVAILGLLTALVGVADYDDTAAWGLLVVIAGGIGLLAWGGVDLRRRVTSRP